MDASSNTPPQQTERPTQNHRHILPEIIEEVLLNLPVKSLLRFSSVLKSWNSMIFEDGFIKRYRRRASLPGRERVFLGKYSGLPLSDFLSDNPILDGKVQFPVDPLFLESDIVALCDELWCLETMKKLFLWNPSMSTYWELSTPQFSIGNNKCYHEVGMEFYYGLGYDSVGDDYKLVKINNHRCEPNMKAEMYSLRSDSWKEIQSFPLTITTDNISSYKGLFVSGALHWLVGAAPKVIISFNLSTETYGELTLPNKFGSDCPLQLLDVVRGNLCLPETKTTMRRLVLWVMEDYGVVESWTKKFDIDCNAINPMLNLSWLGWTPLYFCDDGRIFFRLLDAYDEEGDRAIDGVYEYKNDRSTLGCKKLCHSLTGIVYVESLVSPTTWPAGR